MVPAYQTARRLLAVMLIIWLGLVVSCVSIKKDAAHVAEDIREVLEGDSSGRAEVSAAELQAEMMDFADRYTDALWQALDQIKQTAEDPQIRSKLQYAKALYSSAAMNIAAGPKPAENLFDMVVFITLGRAAVENYWAPQVYGAKAKNLVEAYKKLDEEIWSIASTVLSSDQEKNLRDMIARWQKDNPDTVYVSNIRFTDFDRLHGEACIGGSEECKGMVSSVEKALSQVDQVLLFGERVMYYFERTPRILTLQSQLLLDQVSATPDVIQLMGTVDSVSKSAERLVATVEKLPQEVSAQRRETLAHVTDWLEGERQSIADELIAQQHELRTLLVELQNTIESGTDFVNTVNSTVKIVDSLSGRFQSEPSAEPSKPFDINEYSRVILNASTAARDFNTLLLSVDGMFSPVSEEVSDPKFVRALNAVQARTEVLLERAFRLGLILIAALVAGILFSMLIYKFMSVRLLAKKSYEGERPSTVPRENNPAGARIE